MAYRPGSNQPKLNQQHNGMAGLKVCLQEIRILASPAIKSPVFSIITYITKTQTKRFFFFFNTNKTKLSANFRCVFILGWYSTLPYSMIKVSH